MRYNLIFNILSLISKYIGIMFIIPIIAAIILHETNHIVPFMTSAVTALSLGLLFSVKKVQQKDIDNIRK